MSIFIKILLENGIAKEYPLENTIIIGRSSRANIVIDDPKLSGIHCSIRLTDEGSIQFKDEGSTNGSYLDGSKTSGHAFKIGDFIQIGTSTISIVENRLTAIERNTIGYSKINEKKEIKLNQKILNSKTTMSIVRPKAKIKEILKTLTNQKKKN